jgi:flavin reductase (DIM6/NTAB) family NADH-FMN oxidoreductase RutF
MLVGVSIGTRAGNPKDTLVNLRGREAFCLNIVDVEHLEAMNATSAEVGADVDEFLLAGLPMNVSEVVDAPYVGDCPAVLECSVRQEVDLADSPNTLVIGEVVGVLLREDIRFLEGSRTVDPAVLRPVARLAGSAYAMPGEITLHPRPR